MAEHSADRAPIVDDATLARLRRVCEDHPAGGAPHRGTRATNADVAYAILEDRLRRGIPGMGPRPGAPDDPRITTLPDAIATLAVEAVSSPAWPKVDAKGMDDLARAVLTGFDTVTGRLVGYEAHGPDGIDSDVSIRMSPRFDGVWRPASSWHGRFEDDRTPSDALDTLGRLAAAKAGLNTPIGIDIIPTEHHRETIAWRRARDDGSQDWMRTGRRPEDVLHADDATLADLAAEIAASRAACEAARSVIESRIADAREALDGRLPACVKVDGVSVRSHDEAGTRLDVRLLLPRWDGSSERAGAEVHHDGSTPGLGEINAILQGRRRAIEAAEGTAPYPPVDATVAALLEEWRPEDIASLIETIPTNGADRPIDVTRIKRTTVTRKEARLKSVRLVDGVVIGTADLTDKARMDKGRIVIPRPDLPETVIMSIAGRRVGDLVDIPYVDPDRVVTVMKDTGKNLYLTLAPQPVGIASIGDEVERRGTLGARLAEQREQARRERMRQDHALRRRERDLARSSPRDERHIAGCGEGSPDERYRWKVGDVTKAWLEAFRDAGGVLDDLVRRTFDEAWNYGDRRGREVDRADWIGTENWTVSAGEQETAWMLASCEDETDIALVMLAAQLADDMKLEHAVSDLPGEHSVCQRCARALALALVGAARQAGLLPTWSTRSRTYVPMPIKQPRRARPYDGVSSIANLAARIGENHAIVARNWHVRAHVLDVRPISERDGGR